MVAASLPPDADLLILKERLYNEYQIEIPLIEWNGHKLVRVSIQGYSTQDDVDALLHALNIEFSMLP